MKKTNILKAYIKVGTKLFHLTWEKKKKCKKGHGENEKKSEFGNLWSEYLGFKCGTLIMFGPKLFYFRLFLVIKP
jgi:hypothetical protein